MQLDARTMSNYYQSFQIVILNFFTYLAWNGKTHLRLDLSKDYTLSHTAKMTIIFLLKR